MLTVNEIKTFIDNDNASTKKQLARVGQRYYEAEHDIKDYRVFFVDAEGQLQEDKTKSNIKISHPFFKIIADQEVQYILSGEGGIFKSDIPKLQSLLDDYFNSNDEFMSELYEVILGCIVKGTNYMYAYKTAEGKTAFQCADSMGVVEVRAKETDDGCEYLIFWYVDRIGKDGKKIKRIQVWDKSQTTFYVQEEDGKIEVDVSEKINPRPHITYKKDGDESAYYDDFGMIPFFRLDNNKKQQSGVLPIKDKIDSYDLMNCGLANNIQDTNEALYVVKGFQGDNLDELMMNIKAKKHIGVDEDGGVEVHTVDIPYEARKIKMEIDEKNIFRFGMGVNTESLKDTSATVSVAIKSAYANLDLKCNGFNKELKNFFRKLLKVFLKEVNDEHGSDYQQKDIYFNLEREIITNAQENAQIKLIEAQKKQTEITTLLNLAAHLDNETLMELVCEQLDLDYEEIKDKLPTQEEGMMDTVNAKAALEGIEPEGPEDGDVIE